ncbi:acyl-CoA dehydrogenase [Aquamicrobium lusatiense]|uniref:acyl-CoA dehydrogenase family protein n=1 Tax=Aquamicrobium lusatiense TaxID=89772 RepID=UPI00245638EB|nr:acyl-CoA dehydrogenase [Aquamicrobium lusatiense]MDH4989406.1 acyl-CoA dehydrogenase [Aquamicrobium lusatiense]
MFGTRCYNFQHLMPFYKTIDVTLHQDYPDIINGLYSMNLALSDEQSIFRDSVLKFSQQHLREGALERAHSQGYPADIARLMAQNGLMGLTIPAEAGGMGGTLMDAIIAIETVASVCPRSADVIQSGNFGAIRVLAEYGTPAQRERFLAKLLNGDAVISVGMTEPDAGSAVTELRTTATPEGNGYRINGSKIFTTHGPFADIILAYVRFGPGTDGIGSVLIERGTPGFNVGNGSKFMSGEEWATLVFDDVYVPEENVVLKNGGFKKQIAGFNVERLGNSARSLALGRYAYEEARQWAMSRRQFGHLLCEFQGVQWKFADMRMKLDAAQLLLYRAAVNAGDGFPRADETAIAKAYCNMIGHEVAGEAMQVMGGMGYSSESLVEYCYRRTKGWMIAGGSVEILKNRIAESVFERPFSQRKARA